MGRVSLPSRSTDARDNVTEEEVSNSSMSLFVADFMDTQITLHESKQRREWIPQRQIQELSVCG